MAEHSEAPWRFDAAPSDAGSDALRGHILPHGATEDDPCVAYVEEVGSADLALMLVAPELLAGALEIRCWGCYRWLYHETRSGDPECGQCDPLRAAVAKANGA